MNKKKLADKILFYLTNHGDTWVNADCSNLGTIEFCIDGLEKPVIVSPTSNITDGYREVAKAVVKAGLKHGNCEKIMQDLTGEVTKKKQQDAEMRTFLKEGVDLAEQIRIDQLSESAKINEISERYNIRVIDYEIIKR